MPNNTGRSSSRSNKRNTGSDNENLVSSNMAQPPQKKRKEDKGDKSYLKKDDQILQELLCPICVMPLNNPTTSPCGHNFCLVCIEKARKSSQRCPVCRENSTHWKPQVNRALRAILDMQNVKCLYDKCNQIIKFRDSEAHREHCLYKPIQCPHRPGCTAIFVETESKTHLEQCLFTPCPSATRGCDFHGSISAVEEHASNCLYEKNKFVLDILRTEFKKIIDAQSKTLEDKINEIGNRMDAIATQVADISDTLGLPFEHSHDDDEGEEGYFPLFDSNQSY